VTASVGAGRSRKTLLLGTLAIVSFFNYLDRMALSVLLEPIRRELALSDTQAGLITGLAFALFYAILGLPIARLADRANKALWLAACIVLWSLMTAVSGAATSFAMLFLARVAVGIGEAGCAPTSFAIIADLFAPARRPLAVSVFQAAGLLGVALGMLGAGYAGSVLGWRLTLAVIGLAGLPVAILVAVVVPSGASAASRSIASVRADLRQIFSRRAFVHVTVGISFAAFATYGIIQWFATFLIRVHGLGLAQVGLVSGLTTGVGGMLGTLTGGVGVARLLRGDDRWDLRWPMFAYGAALPLFVVTLLSRSLAATVAFNFVATTIAASAGGVALAAAQRFTDPERRATANAVMLTISTIAGVGLGPVLVGAVSDWMRPAPGSESLRWGLLASTLGFAGAAFHFHLAARASRR